MQFILFQLKCTKQVNRLVYDSENIREKPHTHSKNEYGPKSRLENICANLSISYVELCIYLKIGAHQHNNSDNSRLF